MPRKQLDGGSEKAHETNSVRLAQYVKILAMSQMAVHVRSPGAGLSFLEPKPSLQFRHCVRLTNGIVDVVPDQTFDVIIANFTTRPCMLPKNTVIGYAKRNPLAILTPDRGTCETFGKVLNIRTLPNPDPNATEATSPTMKDVSRTAQDLRNAHDPSYDSTKERAKATSEKSDDYWRTIIDLSHVEDESQRETIMKMLEKHSSMWNGTLGTIKATEHRIELESGTKPIRSMPHRQGPAICDKIRVEIDNMLQV